MYNVIVSYKNHSTLTENLTKNLCFNSIPNINSGSTILTSGTCTTSFLCLWTQWQYYCLLSLSSFFNLKFALIKDKSSYTCFLINPNFKLKNVKNGENESRLSVLQKFKIGKNHKNWTWWSYLAIKVSLSNFF